MFAYLSDFGYLNKLCHLANFGGVFTICAKSCKIFNLKGVKIRAQLVRDVFCQDWNKGQDE